MKARKKWILPVFAVIIVCAFLFVFVGFGNNKPYIEKLKLGLDIEGGVSVVYEAEQGEYSDTEFSHLMDQTKTLLSRRVDSFGLTEPNITVEGKNRIRIELPGAQNIQDALETIGKTATLEFYQIDPGEQVLPNAKKADIKGKLLFTGKQLTDSKVGQDRFGKPGVSLTLTEESKDIFYESSKQIVNEYPNKIGQIAIVLDEDVISAPMVETILDTKDIIIQGNFTVDQAKILADLIKGGALPLNLNEIKTSVINATLGRSALEKSVQAALIGFVITVLIMIFFYRLPGLIASFALVLYASLLFAVLVLLDATMTLPGMAGLVLSIGMAVDANIIIFEGLHEELYLRKNLYSSIDYAFKNTYRSIVDSNVTTLIAAAVLYQFGEGHIKGFAITLMVGIILSMVTAMIITRLMLNSASSYKGLSNLSLYGYKATEKEKRVIPFSKHRKIYNIISIIFILVGVFFFVSRGFNYGIDFQGGTRISVNLHQEVEEGAIKEVIKTFDIDPQIVYSAEEPEVITLRTKESLDSEQRKDVFNALKTHYNLKDEDMLEGEQFGAAVGREITNNALVSIAIAAVGMLIYVWLRFQFLYGVVAIGALLHDVLIMLSFYLLLNITVNSSFIAAILTIVGYSINDTIVIFDKVRSSVRLLKKGNYDELVDYSLSRSLRRTILSSITTFVTVFVLFIHGSDSLKEFALPLMAGVIIGTYSSIFLAGPTWAWIKKRR